MNEILLSSNIVGVILAIGALILILLPKQFLPKKMLLVAMSIISLVIFIFTVIYFYLDGSLMLFVISNTLNLLLYGLLFGLLLKSTIGKEKLDIILIVSFIVSFIMLISFQFLIDLVGEIEVTKNFIELLSIEIGLNSVSVISGSGMTLQVMMLSVIQFILFVLVLLLTLINSEQKSEKPHKTVNTNFGKKQNCEYCDDEISIKTNIRKITYVKTNYRQVQHDPEKFTNTRKIKQRKY